MGGKGDGGVWGGGSNGKPNTIIFSNGAGDEWDEGLIYCWTVNKHEFACLLIHGTGRLVKPCHRFDESALWLRGLTSPESTDRRKCRLCMITPLITLFSRDWTATTWFGGDLSLSKWVMGSTDQPRIIRITHSWSANFCSSFMGWGLTIGETKLV